ncbi:hypothetical protein QFZ56_007798 [Streptomyces achromogenes]|uniref:Integrase catalytic domain-containing protein n=1 Tax=Streptomyces achromogenes TaxID=67255 RepID=A0ABU0QDV5_STRAH|nr:hypothetical protein [Streptomyces achromogenes]
MMYPLVRELAAAAAPHRVPVAVTCRVLNLARQPYYRWRASPVTDSELAEAYRADALFDAHRDDPEFGHRFLLDEARAAGEAMAERTAWRICRDNGWWSAFGKRRGRGKNAKSGPPVHDDLVRRDFTADGPNRLWLTDITEHATSEGKLYLCAVKDVYSGRIVGYSIDARMESRLVRWSPPSPAAARWPVAWCIRTAARSSDHGRLLPYSLGTAWSARWAASGPPATTPPWRASSRCCRRTSSTAAPGPPARSCGSRSSPGSSGPATGVGARDAWDD